jgi:hypothetical protein
MALPLFLDRRFVRGNYDLNTVISTLASPAIAH